MKQTSQAEQPNVPPAARLAPKSTTPPAPAKPLTVKDVRGKRAAEDAEQRPTRKANSSLARALTAMTKVARQDIAPGGRQMPHMCYFCQGRSRSGVSG